MMSALRTALSVLVGLVIAGSASATMISFDTVGDTGTVHYGGNIDGTDVDGLFASTTFTLSAINASSFLFDVSLENATNSLWQSSRISAFGFNVDPDAAGVEADENSPWFAVFDDGLQFPNGFGSLEVCLKKSGSPNNCQGGGGDGVTIGNSVNFALEIFFDNLPNDNFPNEVTLDNFGVRWQSLESDQLGFSDASGTGKPITKVSEPGTLGLLGLALLGFVMAGKRRHKQQG